MAFGFGFNKQKVLASAEKFVQQGKLQNAVKEYEKVLRADPKDLTVMNTIGDLYSRLGDQDKAIECFKGVGDAYATQGFTVKAIAMFKKLTKLKTSLDSVLRLAELYTQQGLFNDARAQYLQVAEEFLRAGELTQAVRIFQKTLEMDPENVAMRTRLAEVYVRLGKKEEAWGIFAAAAESLRRRGALGAAEEIAQRMLSLDPTNKEALLLRGRLAFDSGDMAGAIQNLEKVSNLDTHSEGLQTLQQAYAKTGRLPDAGPLAAKLLSVHNDVSGILSHGDSLIRTGRFEDALKLYDEHSDRLLAAEPAKITDILHSAIGHVRENIGSLEIVLKLLQKSGEQTHFTEVYELLAHAYVQSGQLEKARDFYLRLTQLEPQNQLHVRNYQQVVSKLGTIDPSQKLITAEEGSLLVEELEATAPFIEQRYPDDVALVVRAALTDAELFVSYNLPEKALEPLVATAPKAPRDLRLRQRLASLHSRAGRFAEAAESCRVLESIYHEAGYPDEATRYGELSSKYEERASSSETKVKFEVPLPQATERVKPSPWGDAPELESASTPAATPGGQSKASGLFWHAPAAPVTPAPAPAPAASLSSNAGVKSEPEIDISEEWEVDVVEEPVVSKAGAEVSSKPGKESEAITELVEEIRFYVSQSMVDQAEAGLKKLEQLKAKNSTISELRKLVETAKVQGPAAIEVDALDEIEVSESDTSIEQYVAKLKSPTTEAPKDIHSKIGQDKAPAAHAVPSADDANPLGDFVSDLESTLGDNFLSGSTAAASPSKPAKDESKTAGPAFHAPLAPPQPAFAAGGAGGAAAAAPALEPAAPASTFTTKTRPVAPVPEISGEAAAAGVDLTGLFNELKDELDEETAAPVEDPETHYNLGVAFREMGLLDEAISELQKVCQSVDRGHPFPSLMQTYTWLAQCFLDKGVPEAAIRWYERALQIPGLDGEARMALHYELGSSYQAADNKTAALSHFMEVYGNNIDYRDVAERIKALRP